MTVWATETNRTQEQDGACSVSLTTEETNRKDALWDAEGVAMLLKPQSKSLQKSNHLPLESRSIVSSHLIY